MPAIDRTRVEHVAGLARIALTEEELDRFTGQLQVILGAIEQLKDVDTSDVPPSASVLPLENVMREDEVRGSFPVADVLAQAPDREGDLFRVQASLEERPDA
ncbi:MAG TPA: Asp-tRNA(Asn)/Glu-tRNA(Gln) amidotransferase subunit GatC [Candidatus Limnocylindria bacterium]|nr:Asp-tRNA(Asn)/Glu-tRNA(Gln) amidotransferase subunit GatC [Candidatus Limnocylindria bacterium]